MRLIKSNRKKLIIDSGITYIGGTEKEIGMIKEKLTVKNPAYENALKYSRYSSVAIAPYLTYYQVGRVSNEQYIRMPIGVDLKTILSPDIKFKVIDNRVYEEIKVPNFVLELRPNQKEAAESYLLNNYTTLESRGTVQMPTGKGKSILGLYIAHKLSCKTLVVVHKDDLVTGWKNDIALAFNKKVVPGIIKAQSRKVGNFITIATVQTLNRLSPEELSKLYDTFGLIIQDEMHHCPASSYSLTANFKSRYRLGLTATPERSDGLDEVMIMYYGDICYKYEHDEDDEDILPVEVVIKNEPYIYFNPLCEEIENRGRVIYRVKDMYCPKTCELADNELRLSDVPYKVRPRVHFQDIDNFVVTNEEFMTTVCNDIISEFTEGNSCVAFFTQKEHVRMYYEFLVNLIGESNVSLYYGDNKDNDEVLKLAEKKQKHVTLTTYAKATEGTNVKNWRVAFLISSINNEKNVEQAVGRVRRTKEGKKSPAIVYDYRVPNVYSMASHGNTRDRRYKDLKFSIKGGKQKKAMFSRGFH